MHIEQLFYRICGDSSHLHLLAGDIVAVMFQNAAHPFGPEQIGLVVSSRSMTENGVTAPVYSIFFPTTRAQQDVPKRAIFGAWRLTDEQQPAKSRPGQGADADG